MEPISLVRVCEAGFAIGSVLQIRAGCREIRIGRITGAWQRWTAGAGSILMAVSADGTYGVLGISYRYSARVAGCAAVVFLALSLGLQLKLRGQRKKGIGTEK
jgi:hypothetical protein